MEENFTPSELWLGMHMTFMCDDGCPFTYFNKEEDMSFCEGMVVDEDEDGNVIHCQKMEGDNWLAKVGICWVRYARLKAKSSDANKMSDQVWKEYCEERQ